MEAHDKTGSAISRVGVTIRDAGADDAPDIALIYKHYVTSTTATFETEPAHFREVGFKLGRWVDVGYWQRMLGRDQSGHDISGTDGGR